MLCGIRFAYKRHMTTFSIDRPTYGYSTLQTAVLKKHLVLQPGQWAIRVDFRLFGYRWVIKGPQGLLTRNKTWIRFSEFYPIDGKPTLRLAEA